jgi:hypothetical protein
MYFFMTEIKAGYENLSSAIRSALGSNVAPPISDRCTYAAAYYQHTPHYTRYTGATSVSEYS